MPSSLLRTFVIANPTSGGGAVQREWDVIERMLKNTLTEYDVAFTRGPEHATLLAREAIKAGWEMVVAVGGDGTINEVVNGFFEQLDPRQHYKLSPEGWVVHRGILPRLLNPEVVLGVIPLGTGGDFRRSLGLMGGWKEAIRALATENTRTIDLGQVGFINHQGKLDTRFYINIASGGFSGDVDQRINRSSKKLGGTAGFALATLRTFATWSNVSIDVRLDEMEELNDMRVHTFTAANGEYFGGGMRIAPGASLTDGQLQFVTLGDFNKFEAISNMPRIYSGTHVNLDKVEKRAAKQISVRSKHRQRNVLLDIDGEQPGRLPALFHVLPNALTVKT